MSSTLERSIPSAFAAPYAIAASSPASAAGDCGVIGVGLHHGEAFAAAAGAIAADLIGHPADGDLNEPSARIVGHAGLGPLQCGGEQRFLHGVFGGGEVAEPADHRPKHLRRELAQQLFSHG